MLSLNSVPVLKQHYFSNMKVCYTGIVSVQPLHCLLSDLMDELEEQWVVVISMYEVSNHTISFAQTIAVEEYLRLKSGKILKLYRNGFLC